MSKFVTLHTRVGKPERVCLDFGDGQYEGLGNAVYTLIDDVLRDSDDEVIDYQLVDEDGSVVDNLPVKLVKYMVAIDTASADDRVPLLTTRVGRKWAYTRPVDNPVRAVETKWEINELLLMVHDFLRSTVSLTKVFVDDSWHDAVGIDTVSVKGATRYYFADGGMLDVTDSERDRLVREPKTSDCDGDNDPNSECPDPKNEESEESGDEGDADCDDGEDGNICLNNDGVGDYRSDNDVAPRVCGLVDHCTQNLMDDGGSVCSLSGSDDDVWEP